MSEPTLKTLNRAVLRAVCGSAASANLVADRLEELEAENAKLREKLRSIESATTLEQARRRAII